MRIALCILALVLTLSVAAVAAEAVKISVNAQDELLSTVAGRMAKDAGVKIVVDPRVDSKISLSLAETELPKVLDTLTKVTNTTWKKVQFAKSADTKVTLDQITSSIVALASMPLVAVSVQDGSGKGAGLFARELSDSPDTATLKLPEGYTWSTAYVIYRPEVAAEKAQSAKTAQADADSNISKEEAAKLSSDRLKELASMSPEERRKAYASDLVDLMTLVPEARRQILKDQNAAVRELSPQMRQQYMRDLRAATGKGSSTPKTHINIGKSKVIPAK